MALNDKEIRSILQKHGRIAVYGMSRYKGKAAHDVPVFLSEKGFSIVPVNPKAEKIDGKTAYSSLKNIPGRIDILEVFRPSEAALDVVKTALERRKAKGDVSVIWLQEGIRSEEARKIAEAVGILFIQDRCMKAMYKKLMDKGKL